jgi:hypothetical protein
MSLTNSPAPRSEVKQRMRAVLEQLLDDCTLEDVQHPLYVAELVQFRSAALSAGAPTVSQDEAERRIHKWLK